MLRPLTEIPADHPGLFGERQIMQPEPLLIEENAMILPRVSTSLLGVWAGRWSQGIFDADGKHIKALNDKRGNRELFFPLPNLKENIDIETSKIIKKSVIIYGGTLYEHFGDMLSDACRAYQLLRLYRHSKKPIWFHHAVPRSIKKPRKSTILEWLDCLGISNRYRIINKPILAKRLISSPQIHRDLKFTSSDYHAATKASLSPRLSRQLMQISKHPSRIAYLSRHKLKKGTTQFVGEDELVTRLASVDNLDIVCPEELSIPEKLALWRQYTLIIGFPQSCLLLKPFVPHKDKQELATQVFLLAGAKCLPSTWLNIENACQFGDYYIDCGDEMATNSTNKPEGFARGNTFNVIKAFNAIRQLAKHHQSDITRIHL